MLRPVVCVPCVAVLLMSLTARAVQGQEGEASVAPLLERGRSLMAEGKAAEAISPLEDAVVAEPGNAAAWLLLGGAHLLAGQSEEGIKALERAESLVPQAPGIHLVLGKAYLEADQPLDAALAFDTEQRISGDSPRLSFLAGLAHMKLEDWDRARQSFAKVPETSPYAGRAHFQLALVDMLDGNRAGASAHLASAQSLETDPQRKEIVQKYQAAMADAEVRPEQLGAASISPDRPFYRPGEPRIITEAPRKWFSAILQLGFEYDNNVALIDDATATPLGLGGDRDDGRFVVSLFADLAPLQMGEFTAGTRLDVFRSVHFDAASFDYTIGGAQPYLLWTRDQLMLEGHGTFSYSLVGDEDYERHLGGGADAWWRWNHWTTSRLGYEFLDREVFIASTPATDRDGDVHTVSFFQYFNGVLRDDVSIYVGAAHEWQRTDGPDFDRNSWIFYAGIAADLVWKIRGQLTYALHLDDYENPNSFSPTGDDRDDDRHSVTVRLTRPVIERSPDFRADVYLEWRGIHNESNITAFEYDSSVVGAGMVFAF